MITADDLVRREVGHCVSALVSDIAKAYGAHIEGARDLESLCEQAFELAAPIPDYEEAARDAGYDGSPGGEEEWCRDSDIEPYDREVFEHWIVSDWLADKLAEKGEKVDRDFAGLTVWARTTTGQSIVIDSVVEAIVADLNKAG